MQRRIGIALILALVLSLAVFGVASAHAELDSSDPAAGAKLTAAPAKVTLVFSEEISDKPTESFFRVTDASGAEVGTGALDNTDLNHETLSGALKAGLGDGVYTVTWQTITSDDQGKSAGSFTFGVNADPGVQATAAPEPAEATTAVAAAAAPSAAPAAATAAPTAAPVTAQAPTATSANAPANLPRTGAAGPDLSILLLAGAAIVLVAGLALRRGKRGAR